MTKINENIDTKDRIFGIFTIKDSEGNIIIQKHNMIVLEGKKFLASKLGSTLSSISGLSNVYDNYDFTKIEFGLNESHAATTKDSEYGCDTTVAYTFNLGTGSIFLKTDDGVYYSVTATINNVTTTIHFNTIRMIISDSTDTANTSNKLFSRATIDDVYLSPNMTYILTYNIYF